MVQQALLDAAAEIEGGEEAYAALVDQNRSLREKLAQTQTNLRGAYDVIARRQVKEGKAMSRSRMTLKSSSRVQTSQPYFGVDVHAELTHRVTHWKV